MGRLRGCWAPHWSLLPWAAGQLMGQIWGVSAALSGHVAPPEEDLPLTSNLNLPLKVMISLPSILPALSPREAPEALTAGCQGCHTST